MKHNLITNLLVKRYIISSWIFKVQNKYPASFPLSLIQTIGEREGLGVAGQLKSPPLWFFVSNLFTIDGVILEISGF